MARRAVRLPFRFALAALALLASAASSWAQEACAEGIVDLRGPGGMSRFSVEIADDPQERARGLMFREEMARGAGMLFLFDPPREVSFWMKNTPLPLDLIFFDARGVVVRVAPDATPFSEAPIPSGAPARAVLEINAGLAAALGIEAGTEARHPAFGDNAAWPCE